MKLKSKLYVFIVFITLQPGTLLAQSQKDSVRELMERISKEELVKHLTIIAGDEMEGRKTGEKGQKKAANYIRDFYKSIEIKPLPGTEDYYQHVPSEAMQRMFSPKLNDSENVIAYIKGTEKPDEYIVLSAHYDHV